MVCSDDMKRNQTSWLNPMEDGWIAPVFSITVSVSVICQLQFYSLLSFYSLGSTMSVFHVPGAFSSCHSQLDMNVPQETISYSVIHINSLIHNVRSIVPSRSLRHRKAKICSFSKNLVNQFKIQRFSHQVTSKRWLVSIIFLVEWTSTEHNHRTRKYFSLLSFWNIYIFF